MSTEDLRVRSLCRKRFKGIENFLKRVAFNLGNTPSQTEVKIISCIPIDVTDLQQKIVHLEKQLEEATGALRSSPEEIQTATVKICKANKPNKTAQPNKSGQQSVHAAIVDSNFLNSASEAISCKFDSDRYTCPTACLGNKGKSNVSFVFSALNANTASDLSKDCSDIYQSDDQAVKPKNVERYNDQAINPKMVDHYYGQTVNPKMVDHYYGQTANPKMVDHYYGQEVKPKMVDHYYDQTVNSCKNNMDRYNPTPQVSEPKPNSLRQRLKKKIIKNKKGISPCVYYAQTYTSPFVKSDLRQEDPEYENSEILNRSYLAAMVSKQYKPELLGDNVSQQSHFSSPICRDVPPHHEGTCHLESDICSCCHGQFHNIDEHVNEHNTFQTYMLHEMNTGSAFYDTNQYDLVPVKEKPVKVKKDLVRPIKKDSRHHIDMKCWPENIRTKYRYRSLYPIPASKLHTARPRDKLGSYGRNVPVTFNRLEPVARTVTKRRKEIYRRERSINIETSKSCSIDFGNMYPKKNCKSPAKLGLQLMPAAKKNAECLTTVINNSECQTEMSTIEENSVDTKTEATLNQIKSILQSVLAEVKGSSQSKGQVIQDKPKKDAVVQKGPSHSNMQASTLMNSITYSPYAMNPPPFVTSCSRQISPSQFCYPQGGMKCFHNFPVFIHNPGGRHMCSSCYRSSPVKPSCIRQATTAATNTEGIKEGRSKETEHLIKEIYKSMALNVNYPNKDTSLSDCDEGMKSLHSFTTPIVLKTEPKKQPTMIRNVVQAVSELFMKKNVIETSDTLNSTVESKLPSHQASMQSRAVTSTDTEFRMRKDRLEKYLRTKNKQPVVLEVEKKKIREAMIQNVHSSTESEESSSEPDTDTTIVGRVQKEALEYKQRKGKEGLLTKMLKSVKLFKTKEKSTKRVEKAESENEASSDSDDYQTVYSQKIEKNLRHRSRPHNLPKRKTHSKISYKQPYSRDRSPEKKRSPYMEQEYRRCWDEKLMFQNNRPRYSSERQYSEHSTPKRPSYYQTYEARHVQVDPSRHVPKIEPQTNRQNVHEKKSNLKKTSRGMAWLRRHKKGFRCGEQWKQFVLEN